VLFNTHWSAGALRRTHIRQARALRRLADGRPGAVVILAGDLNVLRIGAAYRRLTWKWRDCFACGRDPTYPAEAPRFQPDRILFGSCAGMEPLDCSVLDESTASDHRPLVVRLRAAEPAEAGPEDRMKGSGG
jgi:endonuclease/exonuclease/phosphatase family metal-dependent hydrolase